MSALGSTILPNSSITVTNSTFGSLAPAFSGALEVKGDIRVNGDIIANGNSIMDRIENIEKMLYIPNRHKELEEKYSKLASLYKEYNETLEAIKTFEILRNSKWI